MNSDEPAGKSQPLAAASRCAPPSHAGQKAQSELEEARGMEAEKVKRGQPVSTASEVRRGCSSQLNGEDGGITGVWW